MQQRSTRARTATVAVPAAMGITAWTASRLFHRQVAREIDDLLVAGTRSRARTIRAPDIESLPEPVRRWLRWAGIEDKQCPATIRLRQQGEFRLNESWRPFRADQYFSIEPPGFAWQPTLQFAPLAPVLGRDRWIDGDASIKMRILGVIPVVSSSGDSLAQSAMLRWLGETMWFPHAAVSPRIQWEAANSDSARATITAGGQTGSATFVFDAEGRPIEFRAERFNDTKKRVLPFVNVNHAFGELHGVRLPTEGEAMWTYDTGDFSYIRWQITQVDFDNPTRFPTRAVLG
jgi:hypothetical protein